MTIARAFVAHLEAIGVGNFGTDLFISQAPSSNQAPDALWWVIARGGAPERKLPTGEMVKAYRLDVYYRAQDAQTVETKLFDLEEQLNCEGCVQLDGFQTLAVETVSFPIDDDIDQESRKVGLLQVTIKIYKEC